MFQTKTEILSGIHTEILSYETNSDLHILVFPGNPGIGFFYLEFANTIIQKINGNVNLYLISYAGFTRRKPEINYSLQEELNHKVDVVNHLRAKWQSNSRIVILGHSIGSWIAKELVKLLKPDFNPTVFMLFPFIAKSDNELQLNFSKFLTNSNYTRFAITCYAIFKKLPNSIITPIVKMFYSHASEKAREVILKYFLSENHILKNIFFLARTEFQILTEDLDLEYFKTHQNSTILFYCANDMWASLSQLDSIQTNVPGIRAEVLPLITHDFCVNTNQCEMIAEKILKYLVITLTED